MPAIVFAVSSIILLGLLAFAMVKSYKASERDNIIRNATYITGVYSDDPKLNDEGNKLRRKSYLKYVYNEGHNDAYNDYTWHIQAQMNLFKNTDPAAYKHYQEGTVAGKVKRVENISKLMNQ